MSQTLIQSQTLNLSGCVISLNLRIELASKVNGGGEPAELASVSDAYVVKNRPSTENKDLPEHNRETHEESVAELKERLRLAELNISKLGELYRKYRLRWLEENHRATILEEYAPNGISTTSPGQIIWNAPSPFPTNVNDPENLEEDIP
ncbi:hypothetical protein DEU56DRAFT_758363 [Suillus clintonianus]|uniref:uncharacterized protein n=1 Tax=Suillus clintonianus TaxID=1904413 RepID=UPI001B865939|nr:uncharacterized protein DEU56DRAFT_762287 [Suillus clintonianus]XP_041203330.1 uncharacterized protein DEU56DRAFT_760321 [Suillus clintonianus]XP_041205710.1 uncharacterized protein DEU56DRAFT_758363 [Suillus clintonianus]KAG2110712.1 hypothetical protein DEU56DRAFT_762287 [Suillus clintonianus]KAG2122603.1 hypothetical protein DEU56DRAFT_760321 [Suillus clintonianus]KAG2128742.1 hypothetical protein DEU56DRAFT_758363 [Suillus clintonianus]